MKTIRRATSLLGLLLLSATPALAVGYWQSGNASTFVGPTTFLDNITFADGKGITAPTAGQTVNIGAGQFVLNDGFAVFQKTVLAQANLEIDSFGGQLIVPNNKLSVTGGGITAATIQDGSVKRMVERVNLAPEVGACVDSTVYRGTIYFGRAGTVTRITYGTSVDPVGGTNTIAIEKGSYTGTTLLSTATVSLNGATANTAQNATLTATPANLDCTATDAICCEYNAGVQTNDAQNVTVTVEFEPDDF